MCVKESLVFFDNAPYTKTTRGSWLCIHIDNCEYTSVGDVFKNKKLLQYNTITFNNTGNSCDKYSYNTTTLVVTISNDSAKL